MKSSRSALFVMLPVVMMRSCRGDPASRWPSRKSRSFVTVGVGEFGYLLVGRAVPIRELHCVYDVMSSSG